MAVATRGGNVTGVIFHTGRGSASTADDFTGLCAKLKIRQSMGRVGSCFDNAAAESFFSTLEWEVLSRHHFSTRDEAREIITRWVCDFYNKARRHGSCGMKSPVDYEKRLSCFRRSFPHVSTVILSPNALIRGRLTAWRSCQTSRSAVT